MSAYFGEDSSQIRFHHCVGYADGTLFPLGSKLRHHGEDYYKENHITRSTALSFVTTSAKSGKSAIASIASVLIDFLAFLLYYTVGI